MSPKSIFFQEENKTQRIGIINGKKYTDMKTKLSLACAGGHICEKILNSEKAMSTIVCPIMLKVWFFCANNSHTKRE